MPSVFLSLLRLFASMHDAFILQENLNSLQLWENNNSMELSPPKYKVPTNQTKPLKTSYNIHNVTLEKVNSAKYLVVEIHKKLKWKQHVANTCKKAKRIINFLQRNLRGCTKSLKTKAYNTYVKPILNYASPIWNLVNNHSLTKQVKQVQRKAVHFVSSDWSWNSSPSEMIGALGWNSLELLRKRSSLVMLHKIVNEEIVSAQDLLPKFSRGSSSNFQQVRVLAYSNSFIPSITK